MRPDLEAIEARAKAASPGPWYDNGYCGIFTDHPEEAHQIASIADDRIAGDTPTRQGHANRDFITEAHKDIPALLAYIRHLEAAGSAQGLEPRAGSEGEGAAQVKHAYFEGYKQGWDDGHHYEVEDAEGRWERSVAGRAALPAPPSPAPAAPALRWTREKPTTEGWYWFRFSPSHPSEPLHVEVSRGVLMYWNVLHEVHDDLPNGEWGGPLPEPSGTPSETPAPKVLSLQDHKDKKALPIILENIQHLTGPSETPEKGGAA